MDAFVICNKKLLFFVLSVCNKFSRVDYVFINIFLTVAKPSKDDVYIPPKFSLKILLPL